MTEQSAVAVSKVVPKGLTPYPKGTSGNPHGRRSMRQRAAELFAELEPDFQNLTATDRVLLQQATLLLARAEHVASIKHADVALRSAGEGRRILQTLRRTASKHASEDGPTFTDIAAHAQAESEARRAVELAADEIAALPDERTTDAPIENARPKPKLAMALDSAPPKTDAELSDLAEDVARVCRGEVI